MPNKQQKVWKVAIYIRISKESGDETLENQLNIVTDHINILESTDICTVKIDDGYSGLNSNRPAFQEMLNDIYSGEINCVAVRDLSRLSRNHIEAGKYIHEIFPTHGIRFISVFEGFDFIKTPEYNISLMIVFRNLINEAYCHDLSMKTRSQLDIKRKKGDFIGSFAVYGYLKDKENRNRLIIDKYPAEIVRLVFEWKLDGMSQQSIADKLNEMMVLSPMEYKKSIGLNFATSFKTKAKATWSAVTVTRILKNEIFIGVLVQGKNKTPNCKIKKNIAKSKDGWIRIADTHEAIISKETFMLVGDLLSRDTRISPKKKTVYLFSGIIRCGECGGNMVRKTVLSSIGNQYFYYVCKNSKAGRCFTHNFKESLLEELVTTELRHQIKNTLDLENTLHFIESSPFEQDFIQKLDNQFLKIQKEVEHYKNMKVFLYESFEKDIVDEVEYKDLYDCYTKKIERAEESVIKLRCKVEKMLKNRDEKDSWIRQSKEYSNFTELTRKIVVSLIDEILVYENKRVHIKYRYPFSYDNKENFIKT